jgi:hypothetical protein
MVWASWLTFDGLDVKGETKGGKECVLSFRKSYLRDYPISPLAFSLQPA